MDVEQRWRHKASHNKQHANELLSHLWYSSGKYQSSCYCWWRDVFPDSPLWQRFYTWYRGVNTSSTLSTALISICIVEACQLWGSLTSLPPDVAFRPGLKTQSSIFSSTGVILHRADPTYSFTETVSLRYSSCLYFMLLFLFSLCFHWQSDFLQVGQPLYLTLESNFNLTEFHYLVSIFDKAILHPFLRQKCNYWASTDKLCKRTLHVSINQSINQSINKKSDKLFEGDFMMGLNSAILQII